MMLKTDIAIIGAGFAGLALAHSLVNSGLNIRIILIEKKDVYPSNFRSDKIGDDQSRIMRELGILNFMQPVACRLGDMVIYDGNNETVKTGSEEYGIDYTATINYMREKLPEAIGFINATVDDITDAHDGKVVCLSDSNKIHAKLVAICTGGGSKLIDRMGLEKYCAQKFKSLTFGFDVARKDGSDFNINGLKSITYHNPEFADGVYYIMFFPIGNRTRCNLFTEMDPKSNAAKKLRKHMIETLPGYFPDIYKMIGDIELTSPVQMMPTELCRIKNFAKDRLIVLGDEFQSVNPGTGTGFSKILSEVKILVKTYIPGWLNNNDFSKNEITKYYRDKYKLNTDTSSLQQWIYFHSMVNHRYNLVTKLKQHILARGYFSILNYI